MQRGTIQLLSVALFVALLTWGVYTTVHFFGMPVHGSVLLSSESQASLAEACGSTDSSILCRGVVSIIPTVLNTLTRVREITWFASTIVILYGAWLGVQHFLRKKSWRVSGQLRPWHLLAGFFVMTWFMFTVLTTVQWSIDGSRLVSPRRVIQPTAEVYTGVGEEGLQILQENFNRLQSSGCLKKVGDIRPGIGEFSLRGFCAQKFFVTRVVSQMVFLLMLVLVALTLGRSVLTLLRLRIQSFLTEFTVSFGLGVCGIITALWFLSVFGILNVWAAWAALFIVLAAGYRHARHFLLSFIRTSWHVDQRWYSFTVIGAGLLLAYFALNFLTVVRPFPIGWDDLGSYLNRPKLLVSYGHYIHLLPLLQWEYFSSLGYLLYGYNSTFGSTAAMMINWLAGPFAVLAVFTFARKFLGSGAGILSALLYYTLPLVGHFSFADMKTDNAVFALQALSVFCLFIFLFPTADTEQQEPDRRWQWLALSGAFCAFAFSTKATAAMVLMALGATTLGVLLSWPAFVGFVAASFIIFEKQGAFDVNSVLERIGMNISETVVVVVLGIIALGGMGWSFWSKRSRAVPVIRAGAVILIGFLVCSAPWLIHNNFEAGNIVPRFLLNSPSYMQPVVDYAGQHVATDPREVVLTLPTELKVDATNAACTPSGREEELGRYWGFRQGVSHYLSLPWRTVMNIDHAGYYVTTMPALLLFPLLLLLPFFWLKSGRWLRWLGAGTAFLLLQWMLLANGVPWYGIGVFLGLIIGLEALYLKAPDRLNRIAAGTLIALSLVSNFGHRFWQYEMQRNLLEYPMGKASAETMKERTIPHYDEIADIIVERHDTLEKQPYVYRIGTFIPYFVPRNLEIIAISDHQLDVFNCLNQERNHALTLQRLQALGFNSIVFDTNTATIETDQQGSLHQKVDAFVNFGNDASLGLRPVVNDADAGVVFLLLPEVQ